MFICTSSHTYTNTPQHKYTSHSLGHRPHPPSVSCLKRAWERGHTACTPSTQTSPMGKRPYSLYTLNTDSPLPPFPHGKEAIQLVHRQHRLLAPLQTTLNKPQKSYFPNVYHFNTPYYCGHSTWKLNVGSCETLWRKVMTEDTSLIRTQTCIEKNKTEVLCFDVCWLAVQVATRLPHAVQGGYLNPDTF